MHTEQTYTKLRSMRLSVMADSMEERLKRGDHRDTSPEEFLGLLVDDEYTARKNRTLSRMIGRANFKPEGACIENIDYKAARGFTKSDILFFTSDTWIKNAQNVVLCGPTGVGKTYIAEAIAQQACRMGYPAMRLRYKMLFQEIKRAKGTGQYLKFISKMDKIRVLVLDDFLMGPISQEEVSELMEILEDRSQKNPTIVTSQYPIGKWHSQLPDPTFADAICDRFKRVSRVFNLVGDSMRHPPKQKEDLTHLEN